MRVRMTQLLFLPALLVGCTDAPKRDSASTAQSALSAAAPKQPGSSPVDAPRVIQTDSGPIAILPEPMATALRRNNPHFRLWPWTVYPDSVRANFHASDAEGLRVVVGDFNGDGRPDVALDGTDTVVYRVGGKRGASLIAILTSGDSATIVSVIETDLPNDTTRLDHWLRLVPAKSFRLTLATDALGLPTLAEPGTNGLRPYQVFWWQPVRKRFVQWVDGE
jgi:hypothetical protein